MAERFELHLMGMDVPEGLIDADRLVEIVKSLQEMATRIGRVETDSARVGRPSRDLERVATLRIGLEKGSTTIIAERDAATGALDLDLTDEVAVDRRFAELIESIGADERPAWVSDSLASTAGDLVAALQRTAPTVDFRVGGVSRRTFDTKAIRRETWKATDLIPSDEEIAFTGRLYAVNLNTHRLQVQDDMGNQVGLPKVQNDSEVGKLVGAYVTVTGTRELDATGKLIQILDASIELAPDPVDNRQHRTRVSLDEILAGKPGPIPGGIPGLTDEEADAFFEAIR